MSTKKNMKHIWAAVERGTGEKQSFWTRIGVAFENTDKSWNLRLDYYPTNPATTLQLRDIEPREPRVTRDG
jgi:hypothetical protein